MPEKDKGENPFLKHVDEIINKARIEREKVDKEAEQERQRLVQVRKENLSNAKKYLVEDVEQVLKDLGSNSLKFEKSGSQSFTSEAFENFRTHDDKPIFRKNRLSIVTMDGSGIISLSDSDGDRLRRVIFNQINISEEYIGFARSITSLAISYDSELIAVANSRDTQIWNVRTGKKIQTINDFGTPVKFIPGTHNLVTFTSVRPLSKRNSLKSQSSRRHYHACGIFSAIEIKSSPLILKVIDGSPKLVDISPNGDIIYFIISDILTGDRIDYITLELTHYPLIPLVADYVRNTGGTWNPIDDVKSVEGMYGFIHEGFIRVLNSPNNSSSKQVTMPSVNGEPFETLSISPDGKILIGVSKVSGQFMIYSIHPKPILSRRFSFADKYGFKPNRIVFSTCGNYIVAFGKECYVVLVFPTLEYHSLYDNEKSLLPMLSSVSSISEFIDSDLDLIFQDVCKMAQSAEFTINTDDGLNYTISWPGIIG